MLSGLMLTLLINLCHTTWSKLEVNEHNCVSHSQLVSAGRGEISFCTRDSFALLICGVDAQSSRNNELKIQPI